jgi:hypothetical protein
MHKRERLHAQEQEVAARKRMIGSLVATLVTALIFIVFSVQSGDLIGTILMRLPFVGFTSPSLLFCLFLLWISIHERAQLADTAAKEYGVVVRDVSATSWKLGDLRGVIWFYLILVLGTMIIWGPEANVARQRAKNECSYTRSLDWQDTQQCMKEKGY